MLPATRFDFNSGASGWYFFCQFYFGNKALSMTAMEGVEGVPVLFVAWNQPDVFRLGSGFKFQTLVRNCLECERKYGIL